MRRRAIVRPPGSRYASALSRRNPPEAVDLALALDQHCAYVAALRACGVDVVELPADDEHPDAVFVQDPVLVVDGRAIVLRSAVESRRGEAAALVEALAPHVPITALRAPATLDGGDVLVTDRTLFIGRSARSNDEGCRQLAEVTGRPVERIELPAHMLHLLSGCILLGPNTLLAVRPVAAAFPSFDVVTVPDDEAPAANVLVLDRHVIVPSGYPGVATILEERGFTVHAVPSSEFEKRDGGVTCRALLF